MSATEAIGTILTKVTAPSFVVAGLTSIGEIGGEASEIDVTSLDSPNRYREFIALLKDGGEVSLEGFLKDSTNAEDMFELFESLEIVEWKVELPNSDTVEFEAFVKSFKLSGIEVEGAVGFTGALRLSGSVTYTVAPESV